MGRLGLFLGFVVGAAIASFTSLAQQAEEEEAAPSGLVGALRRQAREAVEAGREAAEAKEEEMRRRFEQLRRRG